MATASMSGAVLVVEDDEPIRDAVRTGLELHGFLVSTATSAEEALETIERDPLDVVVLDVGLPQMSGVELCAELRRLEIDIPILILSARDAVGDRVEGLQAGADDYLVKPFELSELVARLGALLRRAEIRPGTTTVLRMGSLRIDTERRRAHAATELLDLTRREFDLLVAFATNPGVVISRVRLLELVWGYDFDVDTNVVDVFVGYLRKKMAAAGLPPMLSTVRGVGFVLEPG